MSVFTREDKLFVEYLKDYFAEEMKNGLITKIATFDDREYTFFISERTTLELQIMETGDYNGIYIDINEDELDGNSSEYIIKIAEFMKTHKFLRLYENLKNYWFIPCRAEEYEEKYLNS
ncbi:hypothetical protein IX329_000708 [Fusobacterium necrophorum]|nr:hypothetical protein [Fusobacterium necrophorum]MBR8733135.1 hypothetical protein [Fusobacterium necrophorum]MBR8789321.1 hypothetical protein [Fusobacterium necrophorum]